MWWQPGFSVCSLCGAPKGEKPVTSETGAQESWWVHNFTGKRRHQSYQYDFASFFLSLNVMYGTFKKREFFPGLSRKKSIPGWVKLNSVVWRALNPEPCLYIKFKRLKMQKKKKKKSWGWYIVSCTSSQIFSSPVFSFRRFHLSRRWQRKTKCHGCIQFHLLECLRRQWHRSYGREREPLQDCGGGIHRVGGRFPQFGHSYWKYPGHALHQS